MRNVLSIAITEMTYRAEQSKDFPEDTCEAQEDEIINERDGYKWSEPLQGVILGAFYWGN